jgi:hypothetical protein
MTIARIENGIVAETVNLPYLHLNHACQTIERVCEVTGQDWRMIGDDPVYDPMSQQLEGYVVAAVVTRAVVPLSPGELEANKAARVEEIAEAARVYVERRLNYSGGFLVRDLLAGNPANQRAIETEQWVRAIYTEAEYRKALTYAGLWQADHLDFSAHGEKPWTVAQLMASV